MSPIRLHRWVFDALSRLYPGRYFSCRQPVIRPKRRSVRCELEQYERHEAPTAIMAVDPVTADLLNFAALHEPFPPDATASIAVGQAASLSADRIGDLPAEQAYFLNSSPLSPGGRGAGGEGAQSFSTSTSFLASISAANLSPDLEAIQNPRAPFLDPLDLDVIAPPHSIKLPAADLTSVPSTIHDGGADSGSSSAAGHPTDSLENSSFTPPDVSSSSSGAAGVSPLSQNALLDAAISQGVNTPRSVTSTPRSVTSVPGSPNASISLSPPLPVSPSDALAPGSGKKKNADAFYSARRQ